MGAMSFKILSFLLVVGVTSVAHAGTPPAAPVVDTPTSGQTLSPTDPVVVVWHTPDGYALPTGYEITIKVQGKNGTWTVAASGKTDGTATELDPVTLVPGYYVLTLTATNESGKTDATPTPFVLAYTPSGGTLGTVVPGTTGGLVAGLDNVGAESPSSTPVATSQPSPSTKVSPPKSDPAPAPEKPAALASTPSPTPLDDGELEPDPPASGPACVVAKADGPRAGDRCSVKGRIVVLAKPEKALDLVHSVARVDEAVAKLLADDARATAGEEVDAPAPVRGELEVWLVEIAKPKKKDGKVTLRRYRLTFEPGEEIPRAASQLGAKAALEGVVKALDGKVPSGTASELVMARVVFLAPLAR